MKCAKENNLEIWFVGSTEGTVQITWKLAGQSFTYLFRRHTDLISLAHQQLHAELHLKWNKARAVQSGIQPRPQGVGLTC